MKSTPLSQRGDPNLITRAYNLGLKLVPNLVHVLTESELSYWENHLPDLKHALRNGMAVPIRPDIGRYFMTVNLRKHETHDLLRQALLNSGKKIDKEADQILNKIQISAESAEMDLWEIRVSELGLVHSGNTRKKIYEGILSYGFEKCPGEAGVLARLECDDNEWRYVGMEPLKDAEGIPRILRLGGMGHIVSLDAFYGHPDTIMDSQCVFIFVWPRRK